MRLRHLALAALPLALTLPGSAKETPALRQIGTIPLPGVEGRFDHFAADVKNGRVYLAALGNDTLEVLDGKSLKHLQQVKGLKDPTGVAVAVDQERVLVGNGGSGACDLYDSSTLKKTLQLGGLDDADNVRYDRAAGRPYLGYGDGGLAVIDVAQGKVAARIGLPAHPESFQLESDGPRIFVNVPGKREISVIDRKQQKVTAVWPVTAAASNFPMALDEAHHRLFTGCRQPDRLLVYDTDTGKVVTSAGIVVDTDDLFYDAKLRRLYVAGGGGAVTILQQEDGDRYRPIASIPTAPGARTALFVPDWELLFVAVPHRGAQQAEVRVFSAHE